MPTTHHPKCTLHLHLVPIDSPTHIYNYKGFHIKDITIHSPLFMCCPQCILYTCTYTNFKNLQNMRILYSHSILALPSCILRTVPGPLDRYQLHGSFLAMLNFSIQYENQLHLKSALWIHLNHIPINNMISIRYILLNKCHMENIVNTQGCRQCNI
jgi:hypothetical protein